jgi:hypothetical protein
MILSGKGKQEMGSFWAHHVKGCCMDIALQCTTTKDDITFEIDDYVAGYPDNVFASKTATDESDATRNLRSELDNPFAISNQRDLSLCGADNRKNAVCYNTAAFQTEYGKARAVARLYINGGSACTGWVRHIEQRSMIPSMILHSTS